MITISINPIVTVGPVSVRWYGIMVALAIVVIVMWMLWQVRRGANLSYDTVLTGALVGIPSGIVISKLLHVVDYIIISKLHPEFADHIVDYTQHPEQIFSGGGLTIYGAVLGAALGIWVFSKFSHFQFGYIADLVAPGVILAQAIGRVGCTINGCCYGKPTSLPWGVIYTHPDSFAPLGIAIHPTQVYEIIFCLIVFTVLLTLKGRLKPSGSIFLVYLSLYSLWRFGIDFLRDGTPFLFGLHQAQVTAIIVLAITVPILIFKTRWVRAEGDTE
ncbi:MAG TPA: prolipoprotein diacylglyceryl transferase [Dehalococcoidia bacterium]|nr:prolipoprotein diacylglyceryl transferase [Dehalococcoidia bacterium]